MSSIAELVEYEVMSWPNVEKLPHRFGGIEFRVNGHEIGHLHGNRQADLPFSVPVRKELVAAGRASLHHILPQTGWVSYYIQGSESVPVLHDHPSSIVFLVNDVARKEIISNE